VPSSQLSTSQTNKFVYPYAFEEQLGYKEKVRNFSLSKLRQKKRFLAFYLFIYFKFENEVILEG
jgi:hypothetical protein